MKIFNQKNLNLNELSFSIITPVFNDIKIEKNIKSLINQSYKNFEHIIIDGGSEKKTLDTILMFKKDVDIIISEKDHGIYDAINKGIKLSRGNIIGILNADDFYYQDTLEISKKYFEKNDIDFLFGSVFKNKLNHGYHPKKIWWKFNIFPSHSCSFFVKKEIHNKVGFYNTKFDYMADRDFIFKLIKGKYKGLCTSKNEVFGEFDMNGISSKLSYYQILQEEFRVRYENKQNIFFLFFLFFITVGHKIYSLVKNKFK